MKKIFQMVGVMTLVVGSFMYTEEVALTSKESNELLNEIESKKESYKISALEAIVDDNTIIPGKNGKEVDVGSSYNKMSQIGYFNEKLLVYKEVSVKDRLRDNKDKFIIGASEGSKDVSLIFKVNDNYNINQIIGILNQKEIKATFFITSEFLEKNHNLVINLIQSGHTVGNLSNNGDYNDSNFAWMKTIITNVGKQKDNYCYASDLDDDVLKICHLQNSYTIVPTSIIDSDPLVNIKDTLRNGALISLEVNSQLNTEIENVVNYVMGKGYLIKSLESILKE